MAVNNNLSYNFEEPTLGIRVELSISRLTEVSSEQLWFHHVAPRFNTAELAFDAYRRRFPTRGRRFGANGFEAFRHARENPVAGSPASQAQLTIQTLSASQLAAMRHAKAANDRKTGAVAYKRTAETVLARVVNEGDALIFKSDSGREAFRLMCSSNPSELKWHAEQGWIASGVASEERRKKLRIYSGLAMPSISPVRTDRAEQKQERAAQSPEERGFSYIYQLPDSSEVVELPQLQEDAQDAKYVGLLFDIKYGLKDLLTHSALNNLLTAIGMGQTALASEIRLKLWMGGDGISPNNSSITVHLLRLLDPSKSVFVQGYSNCVRLVVFWGLESSSLHVALARNQRISQLVNSL